MLKLLLKKQFMEFFRGIFHDENKNRKRSTAGIIGYALLYVFLEFVVIGMFGTLAWMMCDTMVLLDLDWFYFTSMTLVAITFGTFGSLFNSYSTLYLAKDNDLLLSMPIPSSDIILSRLLGTYLLGLMYSGTIMLPTVVVYWITAGISLPSSIGCIVLIFNVSVIVLVLSALLGWAVAKISLHIKNRNIILTVLQLAFLGIYMVVYTNLQSIMQGFLEKAVLFGLFIKESVYPLYLIGIIGTGNPVAILASLVVTVVLAYGVYALLNRSFLSDVTATPKTERKKYRHRKLQRNGIFTALVKKEFAHFISSPAYIINCGLGTCFMVVAFVFLLIKRNDLVTMAVTLDEMIPGVMAVAAACGASALACMNDSAAPSVSLEGKNLWIVKSLPVSPLQVLLSKVTLQILITAPFVLLISVALVMILPLQVVDMIFVIFLPLLVTVLFALFGLMMSILMPNLNWTNEIVPIKQSMAVVIALFGNMLYVMGMIFSYFPLAETWTSYAYLTMVTVISLILTVSILFYIIKCAPRRFENL